MAKVLQLSALFIPLAVYLTCFSGSGFDPSSIRGQKVLVTGASTGIGEQLAYQYAKLGARLVITARRESVLRNVSKACERMGAQEVHVVAADMAEPEDRRRVIAHVEKNFKGGLDHLILNHAILINKIWTGRPENLTTLENVMRVNFLSYVDLVSRALPMLTASGGRIGIVSSGFGEIGTVMSTVYSSCKFALHGFFTSLRQELRYDGSPVSVTIVVLGPVATDNFIELNDDRVPTSIFATPQDAARAIMESVTLRQYKVRFDWKMRLMLGIFDWFPIFSEDNLPSYILNRNMTFFIRMMRFAVHTIY